jgi:hypothetical protein
MKTSNCNKNVLSTNMVAFPNDYLLLYVSQDLLPTSEGHAISSNSKLSFLTARTNLQANASDITTAT